MLRSLIVYWRVINIVTRCARCDRERGGFASGDLWQTVPAGVCAVVFGLEAGG